MSSFVSVISLSEIFNQGSYWLFKYNYLWQILLLQKYLFYIFCGPARDTNNSWPLE